MTNCLDSVTYGRGERKLCWGNHERRNTETLDVSQMAVLRSRSVDSCAPSLIVYWNHTQNHVYLALFHYQNCFCRMKISTEHHPLDLCQSA